MRATPRPLNHGVDIGVWELHGGPSRARVAVHMNLEPEKIQGTQHQVDFSSRLSLLYLDDPLATDAHT
jgi:hypothetical protein